MIFHPQNIEYSGGKFTFSGEVRAIAPVKMKPIDFTLITVKKRYGTETLEWVDALFRITE